MLPCHKLLCPHKLERDGAVFISEVYLVAKGYKRLLATEIPSRRMGQCTSHSMKKGELEEYQVRGIHSSTPTIGSHHYSCLVKGRHVEPPNIGVPGTSSVVGKKCPWTGKAWFHALPRSRICADEASFACTAWFLTGHWLVPVCGQGVGDPWCRIQNHIQLSGIMSSWQKPRIHFISNQ